MAELIYRKGTLHGNADSLSRMPNPYCYRADCQDGKSHSSFHEAAKKIRIISHHRS